MMKVIPMRSHQYLLIYKYYVLHIVIYMKVSRTNIWSKLDLKQELVVLFYQKYVVYTKE